VTTLAELTRARAILAEVVPAGVHLEIGIMVEVPAAAAKTAAFAAHVARRGPGGGGVGRLLAGRSPRPTGAAPPAPPPFRVS
ncbi:hypothetical protein, partial [Nocardia neocaledoniensis]|uniref:hypothetical protein n=1 Tax=Nocardia neocaledoniensis TaxID=236511 RepID=UPI002453F4F3